MKKITDVVSYIFRVEVEKFFLRLITLVTFFLSIGSCNGLPGMFVEHGLSVGCCSYYPRLVGFHRLRFVHCQQYETRQGIVVMSNPILPIILFVCLRNLLDVSTVTEMLSARFLTSKLDFQYAFVWAPYQIAVHTNLGGRSVWSLLRILILLTSVRVCPFDVNNVLPLWCFSGFSLVAAGNQNKEQFRTGRSNCGEVWSDCSKHVTGCESPKVSFVI